MLVAERQRQPLRRAPLDAIHAASLLVLLGMPFIEDHAVARLDHLDRRIVRVGGQMFGREFYDHTVGDLLDDGAELHAAAFGKSSLDQLPMIDAAEKAGAEAARKALRQIEPALPRQGERLIGQRRIERRPIRPRCDRHILRALQAAFDLEAPHAELDQRLDQIVGGEILRAQQVGPLAEIADCAIDDEFIRQAAGLGALPPIGAAAPQRLARQALAAVGDAERTVNEHFHRRLGAGPDAANVVERQLAGQDDPLDSQPADEFDPARLGERHLRRAVDRQARREAADQADEAQVLHDDGIRPGCDEAAEKAGRFGQFVGEDQRVEGDIAQHVSPMEIGHHLGQFGKREIRGPMAGVEIGQAEIDRIGPIGHRRAQRFPIAGRSQQFGNGKRDG